MQKERNKKLNSKQIAENPIENEVTIVILS